MTQIHLHSLQNVEGESTRAVFYLAACSCFVETAWMCHAGADAERAQDILKAQVRDKHVCSASHRPDESAWSGIDLVDLAERR